MADAQDFELPDEVIFTGREAALMLEGLRQLLAAIPADDPNRVVVLSMRALWINALERAGMEW